MLAQEVVHPLASLGYIGICRHPEAVGATFCLWFAYIRDYIPSADCCKGAAGCAISAAECVG